MELNIDKIINNVRDDIEFDDWQIKCAKEDIPKNIDALKKSVPTIEVYVILSKGDYFIEPGTPFIRTWETVLWNGKIKNFKPKYINK